MAIGLARVDVYLAAHLDKSLEQVSRLYHHRDRHGFGTVRFNQRGGAHPARTTADSPFVDLAPMSGSSGPMYPFVTYLVVPIINPRAILTPRTSISTLRNSCGARSIAYAFSRGGQGCRLPFGPTAQAGPAT